MTKRGREGSDFDLPAQVADVDPQEMRIGFIVVPPDQVDELLVGEDFPGILDQHAQDIVLGGGQVGGLACDGDFTAGQIDE